MTEIHLERKEDKKGLGWLWALIAAVAVIGLIVWIASAGDDDDDLEETATTDAHVGEVEAKPEEARAPGTDGADRAEMPAAAIALAPAMWQGEVVSGTAVVASVPTDRGFFVEAGEQELFVVLDPSGAESPYEVEAGDRVQIDRAIVRDTSYADRVAGRLSTETDGILRRERVFLVADGPSVQIEQE